LYQADHRNLWLFTDALRAGVSDNSRVRIIGGELGGRHLRAPHGDATRPTSDKVREAIFNILGNIAPPVPDGARVLDLFAGAGGLGLEALSRGAASAVFVDRAPPAVRAIEENLAALGLGGRATVLRQPVATALVRGNLGAFGWIFVDPPYAGDDAIQTIGAIAARPGLVAPDGVVVVEHDRRRPPADSYLALALTDRRRYGDTEVSFYR
jgi:16S rRNA (guanine966-N2)-methyltransferase